MALVINDIIGESRNYYRTLKRENCGRLLINPRGSLNQKKDGGSSFLYLRRLENGKKRHIYIGKVDDAHAFCVKEGLASRAKSIFFLRDAKTAMKEFGMSSQEIKSKDVFPL
jgi:hypothetical protein